MECVMTEVDLAVFAAAHADGAAVIDVREPGEYVSGHVPGAQLIPLGRLPQHLTEVPRDRRIYVICASGNRSKAAVGLLAPAGVDAVSVAGGTAAWRCSGKAVTLGRQP
jgi:rhodanese-related sulfurtransferase